MLIVKIFTELSNFEWPSEHSDTFLGSLSLLLRYLGHNVSYPYLLGVSAKAFRFQFAAGWNLSSAESTHGFNNSSYCLSTLGLLAETIISEKTEFSEAYEKIVSKIDAGHPVLVHDVDELALWSLIIGYSHDKTKLIAKTYWNSTEASFSLVGTSPRTGIIIKDTKHDVAFDEKKMLVSSIELGIKQFQTEKYGIFHSGSAGYRLWIEHLLDEAIFNDLSADELLRVAYINSWIFLSLLNDRKALLKYLSSIKEKLGDPFDILDKVFDLYKHVVLLLESNVPRIPNPWAEYKSIKWTEDMRVAQTKVINQIRELESYAIEKLGLYLTTISH